MGQKEKSVECMKQIYEIDDGYRDVAERVEGSPANRRRIFWGARVPSFSLLSILVLSFLSGIEHEDE